MSQMPWDSSSWRRMGMEGRKWPSSPVVPSPGISQMRKKPSTWSMRYAVKYLNDHTKVSSSSIPFCVFVQGLCRQDMVMTVYTLQVAGAGTALLRTDSHDLPQTTSAPNDLISSAGLQWSGDISMAGETPKAARRKACSLRHVRQSPPPEEISVLRHLLPLICREAPAAAGRPRVSQPLTTAS